MKHLSHTQRDSSLSSLSRGFTIVELLIVIVVIGILAGISIVAYSGIQQRATASSLVAALNQTSKKIQIYETSNGSYPTTLMQAETYNTASISYVYSTAVNVKNFCVTATTGSTSYRIQGDEAPALGNCGQLLASYYGNTSFSGTPFSQRYEDQINYAWGSNAPLPGMVSDNFTVRWNGAVIPPITDTYTFYTNTDDVVRVYINNVLVVDRWASPCCVTYSGTIALTAGQKVPVVYEMREGGGGATARLYWSYTGQTQVIVPGSAYTYE